MPYGILERPSLALGSLQASLRSAGIACRTVYANLEFARRAGTGPYNLVGNSDAKDLLGEWTFSRAAFGSRPEDRQAYQSEIYLDLFEALGLTPESLWAALDHLRKEAELFIEDLAQALLRAGARLVGCTSTFQQHCASLALLKRLKELDPSIVTMMGGANCEGPMGMALKRNCAWVDTVASGEWDLLIVDLVHAVRKQSPLPTESRATVRDLNTLSTPDYQDYFETLAASGLYRLIRPSLAVETSRGCWWGEKHHCTFCGLNGSGMGFRAKSSERALAEFGELSRRHQIKDFLVVDNILGNEAFRTLLPQLRGYRMFVETKANLKRAQVEALADAGAIWILPGLEGLHDEQLRLMDKGTTGVINLQTLKWCRELGIRVSWSILWGFPGESDEWYGQMAEWIPSLVHLQPPASLCRIGYHRFSPYHARAQEYGLQQVPAPAYARVYPFPAEDLNELAYFFEDAPGHERRQGPGVQALRRQLREWQLRFDLGGLPAILSLSERPGELEILDTRPGARRRRHLLTGSARDVYLACEKAPSMQSLKSQHAEAEAVLADLLTDRLLFQQGDRYLALATRGELPRLPGPSDFPGGSLAPRPEGLLEQAWLQTVSAVPDRRYAER